MAYLDCLLYTRRVDDSIRGLVNRSSSTLGLDDDGIHAADRTTGIAPEGNGPGREGSRKQAEGCIRGHEIRTGIGKSAQPRWFRGETHVMSDRHGDGLIDRKAKESRSGSRLIIIGGSNIGGALHAGGDGGKGIGTVNIDGAPALEA